MGGYKIGEVVRGGGRNGFNCGDDWDALDVLR